MGHPCDYFSGTSFSKICVFNHEFKTKSFCGEKSIIRRSFVAAIYQNKPLSPVSFFNRPFVNSEKGLRRARPVPTALVTVRNPGNPLHFSIHGELYCSV